MMDVLIFGLLHTYIFGYSVMGIKLGLQTTAIEFEFYWVSHISGLVSMINKAVKNKVKILAGTWLGTKSQPYPEGLGV